MKKILFICLGNIERSPAAQVVMEQILKNNGLDNEYTVESKGLQGTMGTKPPQHSNISEYPDLYAAAKPALDEFDINIVDHVSKMATKEDIDSADVVIAMDKKLLDEFDNSLMKQFPEGANKFHVFSELYGETEGLDDPQYFTDESKHREIISTIYNTLQKEWKVILSWMR